MSTSNGGFGWGIVGLAVVVGAVGGYFVATSGILDTKTKAKPNPEDDEELRRILEAAEADLSADDEEDEEDEEDGSEESEPVPVKAALPKPTGKVTASPRRAVKPQSKRPARKPKRPHVAKAAPKESSAKAES